MKILKQGAWVNNVRRINENEAESYASLLSTDFEGSVLLLFRVDTYEITDARWAINRTADETSLGEGVAHILIGESAFVEDKNSVKILPDYSKTVDFTYAPCPWKGEISHKPKIESELPETVSDDWKKIRELYFEAMRGAFQAEFYLLKERHFDDLIEYETHWMSNKFDYCRPYTQNRPSAEEWPLYTGATKNFRADSLYNKYLQLTFAEEKDGMISVLGGYHDSFHELNMTLAYNNVDGVIAEADACVVRVPFKSCWEFNGSFLQPFVGKNIKDLKKRDIGKIIGGKDGCFHLVDMIADTADLAKNI